MNKFLMKKYNFNKKESRDIMFSILWNTIQNLVIMSPAVLGFYYIQQALGNTVSDKDFVRFLGMSVGILLIMLLVSSYNSKKTYTVIYSQAADNRISVAERLRKIPLAYFGEKDLSDLSNTIMTDITELESIYSHALPQLYASSIGVILISISLFIYDWKMALALLWVVPVAVITFGLSRKFQNNLQGELFARKRKISDSFQEGLDIITEIKAYNYEEKYYDGIEEQLKGYEKFLIKGELILGLLVNISHAILKLGIVSVILVGGFLFANNEIDIFKYIVFIIVSGSIFEPIMSLVENMAALMYLKPRIERIKEIKEFPIQTGSEDFAPQNFDIEFRGVNFSYKEGLETLKNISFKANQGEVTALVGPSGGGKSTITKLSARFWDVDEGEILLGGVNIKEVDPEKLLESFSIVFQDVVLFNTSILENVRMGRLDATDEEVIAACKLAQCESFVKGLPKGYDEVIGENGELLSGGERQRISIARAILKNSPIILLDEATASLDAYNESKIQAALSELIKDKTVIMIAHRMRTVATADKIVVVKNAQIAEMGSPKELMQEKGLFYEMNTQDS